MSHADQATKSVSSAIPHIMDGKVCCWEITRKYVLNDFEREYSYTCEQTHDEHECFPSKAPIAFTKSELESLCNCAHQDIIFNAQYENHMNPPVRPSVMDDFDVNTLA